MDEKELIEFTEAGLPPGYVMGVLPDLEDEATQPISILLCKKPVKMPDGSIRSISFNITADIELGEVLKEKP